MIVADSSAFMAILLQESDAERFARAISEENAHVSAATVVELGAVCLRRGGPPLAAEMRLLLTASEAIVVPVTAELAWSAVEAYRSFGLGIGKPPCLNFGDCFAYALAKELDRPLLYEGNDFSRTDIRSAF